MNCYLSRLFSVLLSFYSLSTFSSDQELPRATRDDGATQPAMTGAPAAESVVQEGNARLCVLLEELKQAQSEYRRETHNYGQVLMASGLAGTIRTRESMLNGIENKYKGKCYLPYAIKKQERAHCWIAQERERIRKLQEADQISIADALQEATHSLVTFTKQFDEFNA